MRLRSSFLIFFFSALFCFRLLSFGQDIHFNLVTPPPDNLNFQVYGMTQDPHGFLWFAAATGLYKYDGYQYTSYINQLFNPNSLARDYTECVTSDTAGNIWVAPRWTGLDRLDPATGFFTHFRHKENDPGSLASDTVLALLQDHDGILWVGTQAGLDRFDKKTNKFLHYRNNPMDPSSLSCNTVRAVYEDKQKTIWIGTGSAFIGENPGYDGNGGLNKLNKNTGQFKRYMHDEKDPHSIIDNRVRAIFEDSHGNFWVGTAGDGLHIMDRVTGSFERFPYDPSHPEKLSRPPLKNEFPFGVDHITFIIEDSKSRIWIGTYGGGINVYDPSTKKVAYYGTSNNSMQKLADHRFWTAYKTTDSTVWISTWGNNMYKISAGEDARPHTNVGKVVYSFGEDDARTLWLGTDKGLLHRYNTGRQEQFLLDEDSSSLANGIVFIEKEGNKFWLISANNRLHRFDPATKTAEGFRHNPGNVNSLVCDTIFAIAKGRGDRLWIGTFRGLDLMNTSDGTFTHFLNNVSDTTSISSNTVEAICIDKKQTIWIGTEYGLNRLNEATGHFKRYLNQSTVLAIFADSAGNLWCGTTSGLFRYHAETDNFSNFLDDVGIITSSLQVFSITGDQDQSLWVSTAKGFVRLDKKRNTAVLYGRNQGIDIQKLSAVIFVRRNGEILYGDSSGYSEIRYNSSQQNSSPPLVTIGKFLMNNIPVQPSTNGILSTPVELTKKILLEYNQNTFSFEFSIIDFISKHEDDRLLYMLENYDNAWHRANEEKTAYYFDLPPGKYIFKVRALNANGVAAEKDITIIISPPWWRTWWAYSVYILCFLVLSFFANRFIRKRILEKERMKNREKELAQAKEIEKAYNELKSTQAQLIQSEKMASLGELTAGIAHEIQNPLNFVNNFSEVNTELIDELQEQIRSGSTSEAIATSDNIKDNEEKIVFHGKRADAIVKGMLQHSRSSSGQKESTDINALTDEYLRLAYHGLRAKDNSFNATMKTDYDQTIGNVSIVPQDMGRAILNLITNAFYACTERSRSALNEKKKLRADGLPTGQAGYEPRVAVRTKKMGDKVQIIVEDNGNGIPQNAVDKIFQPFFTTKPTGQGTGLGLSLSYDIIKAHGGEIKVETREGEGSKFIIQLPV